MGSVCPERERRRGGRRSGAVPPARPPRSASSSAAVDAKAAVWEAPDVPPTPRRSSSAGGRRRQHNGGSRGALRASDKLPELPLREEAVRQRRVRLRRKRSGVPPSPHPPRRARAPPLWMPPRRGTHAPSPLPHRDKLTDLSGPNEVSLSKNARGGTGETQRRAPRRFAAAGAAAVGHPRALPCSLTETNCQIFQVLPKK